jgi:hypothetical protein
VVGRRTKGSDREIFTDPVHFVLKFQKRVNWRHFYVQASQAKQLMVPCLLLLDTPLLINLTYSCVMKPLAVLWEEQELGVGY